MSEFISLALLGIQSLALLGGGLYVWARRRTVGPAAWHGRMARYHLARARAWQAYQLELDQAEAELLQSYRHFERPVEAEG